MTWNVGGKMNRGGVFYLSCSAPNSVSSVTCAVTGFFNRWILQPIHFLQPVIIFFYSSQSEIYQLPVDGFSWKNYCYIYNSKHRTRGLKPIEYRFLKVVTTYGLIQPVGHCSNHVLPNIRFLKMKFGWTKYNGNVMAISPARCVCQFR